MALLKEFCKEHNYTKRFETFLQKRFRRANKGEKKRSRALALKVIHYLDGKRALDERTLLKAYLPTSPTISRRKSME